MTWSEYKKFVKESSPNFEKLSGFILSTGLISQIGELSHVHQKEFIFQQQNPDKPANLAIDRTMRLGDLYWYLASIENTFNLPDTIYADHIKYVIEDGSAESEENKGKTLLLLDELIGSCYECYTACYVGDLCKIQFHINEIFSILLDYCYYYKVDISQILMINKSKLEKKVNDKEAKSYTEEYNSAKKIIKSAGQTELLIDLKIQKGQYKGLTISYNKEKINYNSKDIIKDFYQCTLFMFSLTEKNNTYTVNYSSNFREFLDKAKDYSLSYLSNGELKSLNDLKGNTNVVAKNTFIKLDKHSKPVLINSKIKKFDDLLDYVNTMK
jgi:hypothetical protein